MQTLAPVTVTSLTPIAVQLPTSAAAIIIDNLTGYSIQAQLSGTPASIWVQSQQGNLLKAPSTLGFSGTLVLTPYDLLSNSSQAPGIQVTITVYGPGEEIPTGYPIALGGLTNIGNPSFTIASGTVTVNGTVSVSEATAINQTGEAPGNSVVYAVPNGDSNVSGAVSIDNLGQATLGDAANNGSLALLGLASVGMISLAAATGMRVIDKNGNLDIDLEAGSTISNGSSSGTAQLWQFLRGSVKAVLIVFSNFKNAGSAIQVALPVAFGGNAIILTTAINGVNFRSGGSQITINILTALPGSGSPSGGGTATSQAPGGNGIGKWSTGAVGAFDTVEYTGANGSAVTGLMLIIGS